MKYFAAALALAASVSANYPVGNGTVYYTTEVVTAITTYCPAPTTITHGSSTYTVTKPTTLTITDCPCTVTKPVNQTYPTSMPAAPSPPAASYPAGSPAGTPAGTGKLPSSYPSATPPTVTAGANKAVALSGAGLAAAMGLAALL